MVTKTIKAPMIIDAHGKWCIYGYTSLEKSNDYDWDMLDECADSDAPLVSPQRYFVTITVEIPEDKQTTGNATPL